MRQLATRQDAATVALGGATLSVRARDGAELMRGTVAGELDRRDGYRVALVDGQRRGWLMWPTSGGAVFAGVLWPRQAVDVWLI